MTFVIFFSRNLAGVGRSISRGFFLTCAVFSLFGMLGAGIWIGVKLNPSPVAEVVPLAVAPPGVSEPSAKELALLQQIGTLSARLMRLEMDAKSLAQRMDAVNEFEARMNIETVPLGPRAKTQPASIGGPLLKPEKNAPNAQEPEPIRRAPSNKEPPISPALIDSPQANQDASLGTLNMAGLEQNLERLTVALQGLEQRALKISAEHMAFPGRLPVHNSRRGSGYGNRRDPFTFRMAFHSGIDFPAPKGTPIYASAGGVVVYSAQRKDYGNTIEIDHGAGLVTRYAHASKLIAKKGQIVMPGQLIAEVGSTGRSTGAHLHFEILKDGRFVNPKAYLNRF